MQINDLHEFGSEELDYFKCLTATEKIEFLASVCNAGVNETLSSFVAQEFEGETSPNMIQSIDFRGLGLVYVVIYDNEMYIKSNSLKALRLYLNKLFEDGNLLVKFPIKKPAGVTDRYYYGYKILSNTTPLCLN